MLIDVDDVALGNATKMRWNPSDQWIHSQDQKHPAIVHGELFDRVQSLIASGARRPSETVRTSRRPYLLRGIVHCGLCGRRMQGSWNNQAPHYRCRFSSEYALAEEIDHPVNVYLRQDAIEPLLDVWLVQVFDPENIASTCASLADVDQDQDIARISQEEAIRRRLAEADRHLSQYRRALDEGGDPATVVSWIAEVTADRMAAELELASLVPRQTLSEADVRRMIDQVEDKVRMLAEADTESKSALYAALGIRLTYDPRRESVLVESRPESWALDRVGGPDTAKPDWRIQPWDQQR